MTMCHLCKTVRRKAKGDSWDKQMCKGCYRLTSHYSWENRWELASYVKLSKDDFSIDLYPSKS